MTDDNEKATNELDLSGETQNQTTTTTPEKKN